MSREIFFPLGLLLLFLSAPPSRAATSRGSPSPGVSTVTVSLDAIEDAPRWMFDSKAKIKGGVLTRAMVDAKKALIAKDRAKCLANLKKALGLGKSLGPWITWNELQCAAIRDKNGRASGTAIATALARLDREPQWLVYGPAVPQLRSAYTAALLALAEEQVKSDRRAAWATLDRLQMIRPWLTGEERANAYRWAGELAFIEQNLAAALDFLSRSLGERDSAELRTRVESIRSALLGKKKESVATASSGEKLNDDLGITDEEREIFARMNRAYETQDYVSAIEDGVKLIQGFPGSRRASEAAERVLEIYLGLAGKSDDKFRHVRETAVKEMQKVDAGRMNRWALSAYARGNYQDALALAEKAVAKYDGHPESIRALLLAAKAALAAGEYAEARTHFEKLLRQYGGTPEAAESTFRLGLLEYRMKRYAQAAAYFERVLALGYGRDFEYRALYWQWRAQQRIDPTKSAAFAQSVVARYPLSYYGLRARAELNGNAIEFPDSAPPVKIELRLLQSERLAWERFNILLKAGWLKEAERELEFLPEPQSADERLVRARFWAATLRYDSAIQIMNKAFDEDQNLLRVPLLKVVFPQEYSAYVTREGKFAGVGEDWIRALIRQESSFRPEARSSANAIGVMQLVPATAQELARDLRVKDFTLDSLLIPEVNIKLGVTYLGRMIRNFAGNVPLALAAYNAGPTRLRRWINARKDLGPLESSASSSPDVEVWMDELPWEETSFYVKSILRNWLVYRLVGESKVSLSEPIWMDANAASR